MYYVILSIMTFYVSDDIGMNKTESVFVQAFSNLELCEEKAKELSEKVLINTNSNKIYSYSCEYIN